MKKNKPHPKLAVVAAAVREAREHQGMTEYACAKSAKIRQETLQKIESGISNYRFDQLLMVYDVLDLKLSTTFAFYL